MARAMHTIKDIEGYFFLILIGMIPHRELKIITRECAIYNVERRYIKIDGYSIMAITTPRNGDDDVHLMEMWCEAHLQQKRVWQCPVCQARNEPGNVCGHMTFGRLLPASYRS
jgi:hypothetical protein